MNEAEKTSPSDVELVKRCQMGDLGSFEILVSRYRSRIFSLIMGMVRNEEDAYDLAQETFVKAWRSIEKFKGDSAFYTWIYRIATNLCIDHARRWEKHAKVPFDEAVANEENGENSISPVSAELPSANLELEETKQLVQEAIAELSPEHRAVLVFKEFQDMDYKEIAETVGCNIGTVMSRLFYARKHLSTLLLEKLREKK